MLFGKLHQIVHCKDNGRFGNVATGNGFLSLHPLTYITSSDGLLAPLLSPLVSILSSRDLGSLI